MHPTHMPITLCGPTPDLPRARPTPNLKRKHAFLPPDPLDAAPASSSSLTKSHEQLHTLLTRYHPEVQEKKEQPTSTSSLSSSLSSTPPANVDAPSSNHPVPVHV